MQAIDKNTKTHQKRFADRVSATDCYGFFNLLTGPKLLDVVEARLPSEHRERLYTPTLTLSMFITQILSSDGSCQNTVNAYTVSRAFNGLEPCSTGTGAYCKARQNLPSEMVNHVARLLLFIVNQAAFSGFFDFAPVLSEFRIISVRFEFL